MGNDLLPHPAEVGLIGPDSAASLAAALGDLDDDLLLGQLLQGDFEATDLGPLVHLEPHLLTGHLEVGLVAGDVEQA